MVQVNELVKAGGKVPGLKGAVARDLVDALACKVVGVLSEAPNNEVRRRVLEKARRMLGTR